MSFPKPSITLVTDRTLYRDSPDNEAHTVSLIEAAIAGGIDIIQLRARGASSDDLALYAVALRVREMTAGHALFVVTGDVVLAEKCHADGILLPESSYKPSDARNFLRGDGTKLVGGFVNTVIGASRAERGGADFVQVGPAFDNAVGGVPEAEGLPLLRKIKDAVHIPVVAFGGINTPERAVDCLMAGADGIVISDAVTLAGNPRDAAAAIRNAVDSAWQTLHAD
jgi:thiamine-phosphate pyrophosphorylase